MKVALFASAFYPHLGGVEEHVRQIAHAYRREGIEAVVLTNRWPRSLPRYEEYEETSVYRLAMRMPEGSRMAHLNYRLTHGLIRRQMLGILRRHRIELLHVHCVSSNGYYALAAGRALDLPIVVTTHGERTMDASGLYQRSALMNQVLRELLAEADHITACSGHTLEDMQQYWGRPFGDRACVVYNGIHLADFDDANTFAHPRPYILGIGRLVPQKGFDVLIEAFAKSRLTSHDLLIAGEGGECEALQSLARTLGVAERVRFIGRANRPTAVALFKGCSFFVLPSRQEPMGIVNLEAMAAGKAIIAARVGGVPEIVPEGEAGLLFPGEDVDALASALVRLAADGDLRQRLGAAGRRRVQGFSWSATAERYVEIYTEVLTRHSSKRK